MEWPLDSQKFLEKVEQTKIRKKTDKKFKEKITR